MYKIECEAYEKGAFPAWEGCVRVLRDQKPIQELTYCSDAERESLWRLSEALVAAAEAPTPDGHEALRPSDAWAGGMALWGVLIRRGYFRVLEPLRVFAGSAEAALQLARYTVRPEEYRCIGAVAPTTDAAYLGSLADFWCLGPKGWGRYDLRPYYRRRSSGTAPAGRLGA